MLSDKTRKMFPYECEICGGGYIRCGAGGELCETCGLHLQAPSDTLINNLNAFKDACSCITPDNDVCEGGQFCWEESVTFQIKSGEILTGEYDGNFATVNGQVYSLTIDSSHDSGTMHVWCSSCYKDLHENDNK